MKITKVLPQKKNPNRFNLFVEDEFYCGVSATTLAKYTLYEGKEISEKELQEVTDNELETRFFDRACEYIGRGMKTEYGMFQYLKKLQYKKRGDWFEEDLDFDFEELNEKIVKRLKDMGYLNDEKYAQLFVESRIDHKPRSKRMLIAELLKKGINSEIAKRTVETLVEDEYILAKQVYEKKYGEKPFTYENQKAIDFLLRKGFNWDVIKSLIKGDSDDI